MTPVSTQPPKPPPPPPPPPKTEAKATADTKQVAPAKEETKPADVAQTPAVAAQTVRQAADAKTVQAARAQFKGEGAQVRQQRLRSLPDPIKPAVKTQDASLVGKVAEPIKIDVKANADTSPGVQRPADVKPVDVKPAAVKPGEGQVSDPTKLDTAKQVNTTPPLNATEKTPPADPKTPAEAQKVADEYQAKVAAKGVTDDQKAQATQDYAGRIKAGQAVVNKEGTAAERNKFFSTLSKAGEQLPDAALQQLGKAVAEGSEKATPIKLARQTKAAVTDGSGVKLTAAVAESLAAQMKTQSGFKADMTAARLNQVVSGVRQGVSQLKSDLGKGRAELAQYQAANIAARAVAKQAGIQVDGAKEKAAFAERHTEKLAKLEGVAGKIAATLPGLAQLDQALAAVPPLQGQAKSWVNGAKREMRMAKSAAMKSFPHLADTAAGRKALVAEANAQGRPSILDGLNSNPNKAAVNAAKLGMAKTITHPEDIKRADVKQAIDALAKRGDVLPSGYLNTVKDIAAAGKNTATLVNSLAKLGRSGMGMPSAIGAKLTGLASGLALAVAFEKGADVEAVGGAVSGLIAGSSEAASSAAGQLMKSQKVVSTMEKMFENGVEGLKNFKGVASAAGRLFGGIASAFNGVAAVKDFANGDMTKGIANSISAVAGIASVAVAAGPVAWGLAGVAAVAGLAPAVMDAVAQSGRVHGELKGMLERAGIKGPGTDALASRIARRNMDKIPAAAKSQGMTSKQYLQFLAGQNPGAVKQFMSQLEQSRARQLQSWSRQRGRALAARQPPPLRPELRKQDVDRLQKMYFG